MFVSATHLPPSAVLRQPPDVFARHWLIHARRPGPSTPAPQEDSA
jgi:hypothetical protein